MSFSFVRLYYLATDKKTLHELGDYTFSKSKAINKLMLRDESVVYVRPKESKSIESPESMDTNKWVGSGLDRQLPLPFFFFFFTPPFPDEWLTDTRAREDVPMERFHLLLNQTLSSLLNLTTLSTSSTSL